MNEETGNRRPVMLSLPTNVEKLEINKEKNKTEEAKSGTGEFQNGLCKEHFISN